MEVAEVVEVVEVVVIMVVMVGGKKGGSENGGRSEIRKHKRQSQSQLLLLMRENYEDSFRRV